MRADSGPDDSDDDEISASVDVAAVVYLTVREQDDSLAAMLERER